MRPYTNRKNTMTGIVINVEPDRVIMKDLRG